MASFPRAQERLPSSALEIEETNNNNDEENGIILPRDPGKLAVTSSLHPFWYTKKGGVVIGLVVLAVIGAIVGGAVGGAKAHADSERSTTSLAVSTSSTATPFRASKASVPLVTGTTFTTNSSGIVSRTILPTSSAALTSPAVVTTQSSVTS